MNGFQFCPETFSVVPVSAFYFNPLFGQQFTLEVLCMNLCMFRGSDNVALRVLVRLFIWLSLWSVSEGPALALFEMRRGFSYLVPGLFSSRESYGVILA